MLQVHAPLKEKSIRGNNKHVTKTLRKAIMLRSRLKNKANKSKLTDDILLFKKQPNLIVSLNRKEKKSSFSNIQPTGKTCIFGTFGTEKFLSPKLCGFRKGYSTQHALFNLLQNWQKCLDKSGVVGTLPMDLSKMQLVNLVLAWMHRKYYMVISAQTLPLTLLLLTIGLNTTYNEFLLPLP